MASKSKKGRKSSNRKERRGGARPGAGRPRHKLPQDVITRLGAPPPATDPTALRLWNAKLLTELAWLQINGLIPAELAATLRATAGSIDRALPPAARAPSVDGEPGDDEEEDEGPELTEEEGDEGLRVG